MLAFKPLLAAQANIDRGKVSILWNRHQVAAALLTEASPAVTAVMDFDRGERASEFGFALVAVKGEVDGYPDRRAPRLVLCQ